MNEKMIRASLIQQWMNFATGNWTKDPPTKPGRYPVMANDCPGSSFSIEQVIESPYGPGLAQVGPFMHERAFAWRGWWWSEPLPELLPAPDWKDGRIAPLEKWLAKNFPPFHVPNDPVAEITFCRLCGQTIGKGSREECPGERYRHGTDSSG